MITQVEAAELVEAFIASIDLEDRDEAILLDSETIEKPWGWVFFYNSRKFVETGDFSSVLVGNAPLIVERSSGRLIETGTAHDVDFYLSNYEATGDPCARPGREIRISATNGPADAGMAARLIAKASTMSIGDSKRRLDGVSHGRPLQIDAGSIEAAASLCRALRDAGYSVLQLPEQAL